MNVKFLCGCVVEVTAPEKMRHDEDGFLICDVHGERRRGWRSLPSRGGKLDYTFAGYTPVEIERNVIFNVPLGQGVLEIS